MQNKIDMKSASIVMVRGLPGSGKSALANAIRRQLPEGLAVVLDPDDTDYKSSEYITFSSKLNFEGVDKKLHPYRFLRSKAYDAIVEKKVVIWNQAFTHLELLDRTIKNLQNYAIENGVMHNTLVVEIQISVEDAKSRVDERVKRGGHDIPQEVFSRFINDYKSFSDYDYKIIQIDGRTEIETSAKKIIQALEKI